jgi:fumarate reductase subunit D
MLQTKLKNFWVSNLNKQTDMQINNSQISIKWKKMLNKRLQILKIIYNKRGILLEDKHKRKWIKLLDLLALNINKQKIMLKIRFKIWHKVKRMYHRLQNKNIIRLKISLVIKPKMLKIEGNSLRIKLQHNIIMQKIL